MPKSVQILGMNDQKLTEEESLKNAVLSIKDLFTGEFKKLANSEPHCYFNLFF